MRVDKYLWCVRKFKTRGLSSEAIKKERVKINDELVKSSRTIKIKDQVEILREGIKFRFLVLDIPKSRLGAKLVDDFIKDITPNEQLEKAEFIKLMKNFNRKKGEGRPTKKDRRDLDRFSEDPHEAGL
tara:strand:+ start:1561 stop:1944 length:384 start_codon:yes stop_codon:yes gene_type:complete